MSNTKKKKTDEAVETTETVVETETEVEVEVVDEKVEKQTEKDSEKKAKEEDKVAEKVEKAVSKQTKDEKKAEKKAVKQAIKDLLGHDSIMEPVEVSDTKTVTADFLNVRRSPDASTDSNIIKAIRKGTVVNVKAHFDGVWSTIDFEGGTAYVMSKYIN